MKYEICYLVGELNEGKLAEIKVAAEKILTDEGAVFEGIETLDRRKLAYKVEKDTRGIYVTRRFELPEREDPSTDSTSSPQAGSGQVASDQEDKNPIGEMTKKMNLFGDVLRFLIIKAEKLPELKQREIPVKAEKTEKRFDRGRSSAPLPPRKVFAPKAEVKATEEKVETVPLPPATEAEVKAKEESIDQKLDELLNI
jgi:ribosomal protein S6